MRQGFSFCFAFLSTRAGTIARQVALPALSGMLILFLLLDSYCAQLISYIRHPSGSIASQVLGIVAAGILIMLFMHATVAASVARLVLARSEVERSFIGIGQRTWRVYVGNLRFSIILVLCAIVFSIARVLMPSLDAAIAMLFLAVAFFLVVRFWFFLTPVCLDSADGALMESWRLSSGHFGLIAAVLAVAVCVGFALQFVTEQALLWLHLLPRPAGARSFYNIVIFYQDNLAATVLLISLTYLCATVLLTIVSVYLHQQMARGATLAVREA